MGFWRSTGRVAGEIVNVRVDRWIGWDHIKSMTRLIGLLGKDILTPQRAFEQETFEQAVTRLGLTEGMIEAQKRQFSIFVYAFLIAALFIFCYGVYLAFCQNWYGLVLALALTAFSLSQAFRYDFWVFQLTNRKLGCSIQEWWNS